MNYMRYLDIGGNLALSTAVSPDNVDHVGFVT